MVTQVEAQKLYEVKFEIKDSTIPECKKIIAKLFEKHVGKDPTRVGKADSVFMQVDGTRIILNKSNSTLSLATAVDYLNTIYNKPLKDLRIEGKDVHIL